MSPTQFKLAAGWLTVFSALCVLNAIVLGFVTALGGFGGPQFYLEMSMVLPFAHCVICWFLMVLYTVFYQLIHACPYPDPDDIYLKNKYPGIWSALHPFGRRSCNVFAEIAFARGRYDDGKDKHLNEMKKKRKLAMWLFCLIPAVWTLNLMAVAVASFFQR